MELHFAREQHPGFAKALREEVTDYFKTSGQDIKANRLAWIKAIAFFLAYVTTYLVLLNQVTLAGLLVTFGVLGMLKIFLALNVAHDAAHNAFARTTWLNNTLLWIFDLLGANGFMWRLRHVYSHHPYANIPDMDADIKQSRLVRLFPGGMIKSFHKYQHLYMPLLYGVYSLHWFLLRDFKDFNQVPTNSKGIKYPKFWEFGRLIIGKSFYPFLMIYLPLQLLDFSLWEVIGGFLIMQLVASYTVATALASAHVSCESEFPKPDATGHLPYSYLMHQIMTTTDFATGSLFITHLYGGFNHHVIHHLYPSICHIHYPELTKILKRLCKEYGISYRERKSLFGAIRAHFKLLRMRGNDGATVAFPEF